MNTFFIYGDLGNFLGKISDMDLEAARTQADRIWNDWGSIVPQTA